MLTWVEVNRSEFEWTLGSPKEIERPSETSDATLRTFCGDCGTARTYRRRGEPGLDITAASLDQPELVTPRDHVWASRQLSWMRVGDGLPHWLPRRGGELEPSE